jgi:hypothetical protein
MPIDNQPGYFIQGHMMADAPFVDNVLINLHAANP